MFGETNDRQLVEKGNQSANKFLINAKTPFRIFILAAILWELEASLLDDK